MPATSSCGHSLHRDCLRFYGFGEMVACFRYVSIKVHSVYLPPPKLDFTSQHQEWVEQEANEVVDSAELLFTEVLNALHQISERRPITGSFDGNIKILELRRNIMELEDILQAEKADFTVKLLEKADFTAGANPLWVLVGARAPPPSTTGPLSPVSHGSFASRHRRRQTSGSGCPGSG